MPVVLAGAAGFSAVSSIMGGVNADSAASREAKLQQEQGRVAMDEAQTNATNEAYNQTQAVGNQKLAFLANGVTLEGSPSAVLNESKRYGQTQVDAILKQGSARYNLAMSEAANTKSAGRAALIAGISEGVSTGVSGYGMAKKAGMFDAPVKKT